MSQQKEVTGNSVYQGFLELIRRGQRVRCSRSGRYFYWKETLPDGRGGRVSKEYDYWVHDQIKTLSKYKEGPDWKRNARFLPSSMSHAQVDTTVATAIDYSITATDRTVNVTTTAGNITITLLSAEDASNTKLTITKATSDANTVIVTVSGSNKIVKLDGSEASTYTLTDDSESIDLISDQVTDSGDIIGRYYVCRN